MDRAIPATAAHQAVLEYLQEWSGVTRTGYHGVRVDGQEPGRFEEAGLVVTSWLQGTSRDGDPQDHVHNQIARITRTVRDGKWRALDTASLRALLGALQGIAATTVECELTREFGVAWVPRTDGRGNEIADVTQAQMDAYSTRTVQVHEKERELAQAWERRHERAPTSREQSSDLAYAITGHSAQGATVHTGITLVTGTEDRQWLYPAMTRGTDANLAFVFTTPPKAALPGDEQPLPAAVNCLLPGHSRPSGVGICHRPASGCRSRRRTAPTTPALEDRAAPLG